MVIAFLICPRIPDAAKSWATIRRSLRSALSPKSNGGRACTQNHTRIGNLSRWCAAEDAEEYMRAASLMSSCAAEGGY